MIGKYLKIVTKYITISIILTGIVMLAILINNLHLNNQVPIQNKIGNKVIIAEQMLTFTVNATDEDSDKITYGTNATKGTLNSTTGVYSWKSEKDDVGTYTWYFNSSDGYGGEASETLTITVNSIPTYIPPTPIDLTSTQGNFWINNTWQAGIGNITDSYNVSINGEWINGTKKTYFNNSVVPHGWSNISVYTYNISGNGSLSQVPANQNIQVANNVPIQAPIGNKVIIVDNWLNFTISATDADSDLITYGTNATKGILNSTTGVYSWKPEKDDVGTYVWSFNSSDNYGGTANETIIVKPPDIYIPPTPIGIINTQGNFWINNTWQAGTGNITDSYNVSINGEWINGTANTYYNSSVGPHGWSNISVYAYNNSANGSLSPTSIVQNIQVANNAPIQAPIGNKIVIAGQILTFTILAIDIDSDVLTYGTNATKGDLDTLTGVYSWTPTGKDVGNYNWYFNSSDGYGGVASEITTITIINKAHR